MNEHVNEYIFQCTNISMYIGKNNSTAVISWDVLIHLFMHLFLVWTIYFEVQHVSEFLKSLSGYQLY